MTRSPSCHTSSTWRASGALPNERTPARASEKDKETPRDYNANAVVWDAVYDVAEPELKEAVNLAYLTGQRPADVILMRSDDRDGDYFMVIQGKTKQKLRVLLTNELGENSLGRLIREITERNAHHPSKYLLISKHGKRMTKGMLRLRWDKAQEKAQQRAIKDGDPMLAAKIEGGLSSGTSGQRSLQKLSISAMPACCWDIPNRRSPSASTGESV